MRTAALALLAILGGCTYGGHNPWDTEGDAEEYREKTEENWLLELETLFLPPQRDAQAMVEPELEAWRDTVLPNADGPVLEKMREQSLRKIAGFETGIRSQLPPTENNKEQLTELVRLRRTEKTRLELIDQRMDAGR